MDKKKCFKHVYLLQSDFRNKILQQISQGTKFDIQKLSGTTNLPKTDEKFEHGKDDENWGLSF